jgi:ribosomal protein L9
MGAGIVVFACAVLYGNAIAAPMEYAVDGLAIGTQLNFGSASYREYKCSPSDQFDGLTWCQKTRSDKERRRSYIAAYSLLHSRDGNILYINRTQEPAFFNPKEVEVNIQRYSRKIGESPRIMKMPHRGSLPDGLIAVWGKITLEPLDQESIKTLADGKNPRKGFLIDYLRDFTRSAKQGLPIYRIDGGPGFIWAASFDQKERGTLRLAAVELPGFSSASDPAPVLVETTAQTRPSDPAPVLVEIETTAQTRPSDPAPVVVQATAQTDQEQFRSESSQTVENLRADLAISVNKIAELEKAKAEAERAAKQAEQAKLDAENAKQEVERARIADKMTSDALVAQVRADKVAAGAKSSRWENALYGSVGGLIVVLTASAIGFLMNRRKTSVSKQQVWKLGTTKPIEASPHCQKSEAELKPSALSPEIAIFEAAFERELVEKVATNASGWGDMIRKTISCALAGLLTVVSALAFVSGLLGYWEPSSGVVVLSLIFGFTIGVMWLGSEVVGDFPEWTMSRCSPSTPTATTSRS